MVTVNMLKPYYVKADDEFVRIILAYQYFSVTINDDLYQYVPVEAKEIRINRRSQKVDNIEAKFTFQKGKNIVHISMAELVALPDFLMQLRKIAEPYYIQNEQHSAENNDSAVIIGELEQLNVKRLIDKALDDYDEKAFYALAKLL